MQGGGGGDRFQAAQVVDGGVQQAEVDQARRTARVLGRHPSLAQGAFVQRRARRAQEVRGVLMVASRVCAGGVRRVRPVRRLRLPAVQCSSCFRIPDWAMR
ncbi:hypothetical protein GCM10014715_18180 [Streptomyces spiralis]|uniref:Uncharacterized protein n=1 Tax=Streptomyces spiralis TaxID=66376 RepID=A0A919DQ79_9ACTN|nr:hypothetical protein GCM10014715_18180 [Streptomyces spiralis]